MTAPDQSPSPATSGEGLFAVLERSRSLGFLGPGPVSRHVAHAEAMGAAAGRPDGPVLDLGAGGGVPGLVLALAWPGTSWTLLDASERRAGFLENAVLRLGLADRVSVLRARAEDAPRGLVERERDRKSTRLNSSHSVTSRMPSSA